MSVESIVAILALALSVLGFIIIRNTVWWRIRNRWRSTFIQLPSLSEQDKHYVRIIKHKPQPTESICRIENDELHIPINNGKELVYSVTIDKDSLGDNYHLKLRREESNTPIDLYLHRPNDLPAANEQIRLIYVNIKTFGKN